MKAELWEKVCDFIAETTVSGWDYWYPLDALKIDVPVAAYDLKELYDENIGLLEAVVRRCGITAVTGVCSWLRTEDAAEGVVEGENLLDLLRRQEEHQAKSFFFWKKPRQERYYTFPRGGETYYFDESRTWMIYVSHAGSLTFAGAEIAAAAREIIPDEFLVEWAPEPPAM